jgi:hypothetical protein
VVHRFASCAFVAGDGLADTKDAGVESNFGEGLDPFFDKLLGAGRGEDVPLPLGELFSD